MKRENLGEKEMPFLDHLEELRWRLLKSLISVFVFMLIALAFSDYLLEFLLYPGKQLEVPIQIQVLKVQTVFMIKLEMALVAGVIFSLPVIIYQVWQFIAPGLLEKERRYLPLVIISTVGCFLIGVAFAYYIIIPYALEFFFRLAPEGVENHIALDFYIGFILRILVIFGVVFELPIISMILTRIGILTPTFMRRFRKHSIVTAFVLGALLTPPDPTTQVMLAIPLILLYEFSIYISYLFMPKELRIRLKQVE